MLKLNQKDCILAISLLFFSIFFSYFMFDNAYGQLSPEDQALFDQATKNAQSSLEQPKQEEKQPTSNKEQVSQQQKTSGQFFSSNKEIIKIGAKFKESFSLFSQEYSLISHSLTMNEGNPLCPENNCKVTLIDTKLSQDPDFSDYDFKGNIQVETPTSQGLKTKLYNFVGDFEVKEKIQNGLKIIYNLAGSFDINEGDNFKFFPDYPYMITKAQVTYENKLPVLIMEVEN